MTICRDVQLGCILRPPLFFLSRSSPPGWLRQTLTKTATAVSFNQAESPSYAIRNSINFDRYYRQLGNKKFFKKSDIFKHKYLFICLCFAIIITIERQGTFNKKRFSPSENFLPNRTYRGLP